MAQRSSVIPGCSGTAGGDRRGHGRQHSRGEGRLHGRLRGWRRSRRLRRRYGGALLAGYIERFNARDFDAVRDMLADEVRLDLVSRSRRIGRNNVAKYFENYSALRDWQLVGGLVDRRPAVQVRDPDDASGAPIYFVVLQWADQRLVTIRDFRYARYAMEGAELVVLG